MADGTGHFSRNPLRQTLSRVDPEGKIDVIAKASGEGQTGFAAVGPDAY